MKGGLELEMTAESLQEPWYKSLARKRQSVALKDTIPQALADGWTAIMTEAVRFFHEPGFVLFPAVDYVDSLSTDEVTKRIAGYQLGYDKEYLRQKFQAMESPVAFTTEQYRFSKLPVEIQRAVVSLWDKLHYEWLTESGATYTYAQGYYWVIEDTDIPYQDRDGVKMPDEAGFVYAETIANKVLQDFLGDPPPPNRTLTERYEGGY